jgi:hypothetical protein
VIPTEYVDVRDAVAVAQKVELAGASGGVKCAAVEFWARIRSVAEAELSLAVRAFESTQEFRVEGHASSVGWMKSHCGMDGRDAARVQRNSRRLKAMPLTEEALSRGEITMRHVEVLHEAVRAVGEDLFRMGEEALVDNAVLQRFSDFEHSVRYFIVRVGPRKAKENDDENTDNRYASSSRTFEGNGVVDAQLEPIGFTLWDAELNRCMDHLFEQDWAAAKDRLGRRPLQSELDRTTRQRRADAMVLMAQRSAAHGDDDLPPSRFTLLVHGDAELVGRLIEFLLDDLAADDPDAEPDLGRIEYGEHSLHELDDGTVVTVNTLLLALLSGVVRGVLFDPHGEVLRLGHQQQLFSKVQRIALAAKYRRCGHIFGCDRTNPGLQADHKLERARGGPTDIDNGDLLDGPHNRHKENTKDDRPEHPPDPGHRRLPPDTGPLPR